jgi:hypothetical protein
MGENFQENDGGSHKRGWEGVGHGEFLHLEDKGGCIYRVEVGGKGKPW